MMDEYGVRLLLHTIMIDTICEGNRVRGIVVESKSGREAIMAKTIIDATGDGDVAFRAGASIIDHRSSKDYAVANNFAMCNVNLDIVKKYLMEEGLLTQLAYTHTPSGVDRILRIGMNLKQKWGQDLETLGI